MTRIFSDNVLLGPRDEFIIANLGLVHAVARSYRNNGGYEDIVSEGTIGLINAYDRFNNADLAFSTFAVPYIRGYIRNYLRKQSGSFSAPTRTVGNARKAVALRVDEESPEVIAETLNISPKYAKDVVEYLAVRTTTSIGEGELDAKGYDDNTSIDADAFINEQSASQQRILRALMDGYSQTAVAEILGVTRQRVSQSVKQMRVRYEKDMALSA